MKYRVKNQPDEGFRVRRRWRTPGSLVLFIFVLCALAAPSRGATTLTVADARVRAVTFNRQFLSAQQDVSKAQAQIDKAWSGVLPDITADGSYTRNFVVPSFFLFTPDGPQKIEAGARNSFGTSLTIRQPLWEGAKALNALAISKLYREYSADIEEQVKAAVVYNAEVLFYAATLARANLEVVQKALEANSHNLGVVEKLYNQGMVSQFELLRARVEKSNLLPAILAGESEVELSQKRLKAFLGVNLGDTLILVEEIEDTSLVNLPPLGELVQKGLAHRPEIDRSRRLIQLTQKAIKVAKGEYQPSLDAVVRFGIQSQSNDFKLNSNVSKSYTAGLNLKIPIFQGGRVSGEVSYRKAENTQAVLADKQQQDDVRLEIEEAYDRIIQAKKTMDIQGETIAQAEEGLRIANLRFESGQGTQLEVLSAQTALTESRRAQAAAVNFFRQAKAALKKATTLDMDTRR